MLSGCYRGQKKSRKSQHEISEFKLLIKSAAGAGMIQVDCAGGRLLCEFSGSLVIPVVQSDLLRWPVALTAHSDRSSVSIYTHPHLQELALLYQY